MVLHGFYPLSQISFPLLADFEPKGEVARLYDAYDEKEGECKRALYVLDEEGIIRWCYLSPTGVNPGANGEKYEGGCWEAGDLIDFLRDYPAYC